MVKVRSFFELDARHLRFAEFYPTLFTQSGQTELYEATQLAGPNPADPGVRVLVAYMALYADEDGGHSIRFLELTRSNLTARGVAAQLSQIELTEAQRAGMYTQIVSRTEGVESIDADIEEVVLAMASGQVQGLELPIAFVTYMSLLSGARQVHFWNARLGAGAVLYEIFRRNARNMFL